ncbi:uncharacterized protein LOC111372077 isoform X3 [Olea europaea subsp. europaea]|uniref:Uncharacterized protein LOC111372077 isoform X3 n=1 Tax=Olea europaea subsp. europaea TaxID=158383 RepID=A0A8S0Q801_OLEEU|nr:uncharacterized protein LOC111372077 isoform X3 [Olea europaea subsp. europaea]
MKKEENKEHQFSRDVMLGGELWTDGLICAFEFIRGHMNTYSSRSKLDIQSSQPKIVKTRKKTISKCKTTDSLPQYFSESNFEEPSLIESGATDSDNLNGHFYNQNYHLGCFHPPERSPGNCWMPIGWARISDLLQKVQVNAVWDLQHFEFTDEEDDMTVADIAAPYWERPTGPTWWCHVDASHPFINTWLSNAQWLHPAISIALRDESKLISERMKHLLYEELLAAGGSNLPRTSHEVIALLACRLARWDDRLFRKYIFGVADEIELKFMDRRTHEDMHLFGIILNHEIRSLSTQVIRVKWSLHAREEIVFELLQHLRGNAARSLLEGIRKSTRAMIQEQEAVRGRLFTIQDVMQSTVRACLQDQSLHVQHNLGVFGGCGLVLSIIAGLFGTNLDGIPGAEGSPYAFALFSSSLFLLGIVLIATGLIYLGLKKPQTEEKVEVRKLELQDLVRMFQHEAETHAQVRKTTKSGENFVHIN